MCLFDQSVQFGNSLLGQLPQLRRELDLAPAHELLQRFAGVGGRIVVCGIAMERSAIAEDNLIPGATIERNVFVSSVALQNRGYAYMPIS